jgi:hypothetical protein
VATAAPQILDLMNTLANSSEAEIIKALKALLQCIKASAEATKMRTTSKVVKSRSKKERAKQDYGTEKAYSDTPQAIEIAGDDLCGTSQSTSGKVASRLALHRWSLDSKGAVLRIITWPEK